MTRDARATPAATPPSRAAAAWAAVALTLRQLGRADALRYFAGQALQRGSAGRARIVRYYLVAQPVKPVSVQRAAASTTVVRRLEPGDAALALLPRSPQLIAERFANGDLCLAVLVKDRLAAFLWLAFDAYEEDDVCCRYRLLDSDLAWDYDVHVEPDFRMGRSLARLWDAANALLGARGVRWSLSRISAFNSGSLAAHERLGARRLFGVTFVCLGRLQLAFGARRFLPTISLKPATRPVLGLRAPADRAG